MAAKKVVKTKVEVAQEFARKAAIDKQKELARRIFSHITEVPSVYDAQTTVNAAAGFIEEQLMKKQNEFKVSDLSIGLDKEEASPIKTALVFILNELHEEKAQDSVDILKKMGNAFPGYIASKYMKEKMDIAVDEFVA